MRTSAEIRSAILIHSDSKRVEVWARIVAAVGQTGSQEAAEMSCPLIQRSQTDQ